MKLYEQTPGMPPPAGRRAGARVYSARDRKAVAPAHEHAAAALGEITGQQGLALAQPAHAWNLAGVAQ